MAAPPETENQIAFFFPDQVTYTGKTDQEDVPFNPTAPATVVKKPPVRVSCGIEYFDAQGNVVVWGTITPSRVRVMVFDEDYVKIQGTSFCVIQGERFLFRHEEIERGLFEVGMHYMHFQNENEI